MLARTMTLTLRRTRLGVGVLGLVVFPLCVTAAEPPEPLAIGGLKHASTTIQAISQSDRQSWRVSTRGVMRVFPIGFHGEA